MRLQCLLVLSSIIIGCSEPMPTPEPLEAEFRAILTGVDEDLPGRSITQLADFMVANREFEIATRVEEEIDRLRTLSEGRYRDARDLARAGAFDEAEAILTDLSEHLSETEDGERAAEHLDFDFHYGKAQALAAQERWDEAGAVAQSLLEHDLTREQENRLQAVLDAASTVGAAYRRATRAQATVDTQLIVMYMEMTYAETGEYPARLTLRDLAEWDPVGTRSMRRSLSRIEEYRRRGSGYSFTAVSADEQHRVRVVDGVVER